MKQFKFILLAILFISMLAGCDQQSARDNRIYISDKKQAQYKSALPWTFGTPVVWDKMKFDYRRGQLTVLPFFSLDAFFSEHTQLDLCSYNLSKMDFKDRANDLWFASFDNNTIWPDILPENFDPESIMQLGKNPCLNLRALHEKDITGDGIGIAIAGRSYLAPHSEYKERVKLYQQNGAVKDIMSTEGTEAVSIAAGSTLGVAPGAYIYYFADSSGGLKGNQDDIKTRQWAIQTIERVMEINKTLPLKYKIRVICFLSDWFSDSEGYEALIHSVKEARQDGIFVISQGIYETYQCVIKGLGRGVLSDPDNLSSYNPKYVNSSERYTVNYNRKFGIAYEDEILFVPMGSRCVASPTGENDYKFSNAGSPRQTISFISGMYALACQVRQDITPEIFLKCALETGEPRKNADGEVIGEAINPVRLIDRIQSMK